MKFALILILMIFSVAAKADRSVSIVTGTNFVELTNGSTVTVTYDIECYDKVTGSTIVTSTGATLSSKKTAEYKMNLNCASGATTDKTLSQGAIFCGKAITFSDRATACGTNMSTCSITKLSALAVSGSEFLNYYWIEPTDVNAWYISWDSGSTWQTYSSNDAKKPYAPATSNKNSIYRCANDSSHTPYLSYCSSYMANSTATGTLCCPSNNGFSSCKVTIKSTTPTSGFLQSPQFKGGSPF